MQRLEYIAKLEAQEKASPMYLSQQYEYESSPIDWPQQYQEQQQYHEEPPSPKSSHLEEVNSQLEEVMSAFLSHSKAHHQLLQSTFAKMEAHLK